MIRKRLRLLREGRQVSSGASEAVEKVEVSLTLQKVMILISYYYLKWFLG